MWNFLFFAFVQVHTWECISMTLNRVSTTTVCRGSSGAARCAGADERGSQWCFEVALNLLSGCVTCIYLYHPRSTKAARGSLRLPFPGHALV